MNNTDLIKPQLSDDEAGKAAFQADFYLMWGEMGISKSLLWEKADKPRWIAIARAVLAARSET